MKKALFVLLVVAAMFVSAQSVSAYQEAYYPDGYTASAYLDAYDFDGSNHAVIELKDYNASAAVMDPSGYAFYWLWLDYSDGAMYESTDGYNWSFIGY